MLYNKFYSINDFDWLSDDAKKCILEYLARKLWIILEETSGEPDYYGKSYDPLVIDRDENLAYSYVFQLETGGRTHPFSSLKELEDMMMKELINEIKTRRGAV